MKGKHMKRLYMVNGRQVRSHLRGRVRLKEGRAREQGSIFMPERTDLGVSILERNMFLSPQIVMGITEVTG
eukprot:603642-Pelagomonas_calceolata.AAC.1